MFLTDIYPATLKTRHRDPSSRRVTDIWAFKSTKSNKRYIVEIEGFENEFFGIKFYWKGVEKSPLRYSLLTNDYEPRRIIDSCINIMIQYYRRTPTLSFGFVAAPDLESDLRNATDSQHVNRRFRLYRALMLSYFGPRTFVQIATSHLHSTCLLTADSLTSARYPSNTFNDGLMNYTRANTLCDTP